MKDIGNRRVKDKAQAITSIFAKMHRDDETRISVSEIQEIPPGEPGEGEDEWDY